jgi:hypothetical protein
VIGPRLSASLVQHRETMAADPEARAIYLDAAGNPWPQGHKLKNPAYAQTLRAIAADGPECADARRDRRGDRRGRPARAARGRAGSSIGPRRRTRRAGLDPLCAPFRVDIASARCRRRVRRTRCSRSSACTSAPGRGRTAPATCRTGLPTYLGEPPLLRRSRSLHGRRSFRRRRRPQALVDARLSRPARRAHRSRHGSRRRSRSGRRPARSCAHRWGSDRHAGARHHAPLHRRPPRAMRSSLTATIESEYGAQRMAGGVLAQQPADRLLVRARDRRQAGRQRGRAAQGAALVHVARDRHRSSDGKLVLVAGSMGGSTIIASVARSDHRRARLEADAAGRESRTPCPVRTHAADPSRRRGRMPIPNCWTPCAASAADLTEAGLYGGTHVIQVTPQGLARRGGSAARRQGCRPARAALGIKPPSPSACRRCRRRGGRRERRGGSRSRRRCLRAP